MTSFILKYRLNVHDATAHVHLYIVYYFISRMLQQFAHDYNLAIPGIDFTTYGEQYSFVQKQTMLDYILFDKSNIVELGLYNILKAGPLW